jgi:hypothetical protein
MDTQWRDDVLSYLKVGLFDQRSENRHVISKLANGNSSATPQSSNAFTMRVSDYIEASKVIGALENPQPDDLKPSESIGPVTPGVITVVRGVPKLAFLHDLGSRLKLPANYLLEHLAFPHSFRIRALPSRMHPILIARFISLGSFVFHQPPHPTVMAGLSERLAQKMYSYSQECFVDERVGVDVFREVNLHDCGFFSVEQQATFVSYIDSKDTQEWSGILLTDSGLMNRAPPWKDVALSAHFHPVSGSGHSSMEWQRHHREGNDHLFLRPEPFFGRLKVDCVMSDAEQMMCQISWLGFASDLLDTSALTWAKFLSFIRASHEAISGDPEYQAGRLRADKKVLDRATQYFDDVVRFICEIKESRPMNTAPPDLEKQIVETTSRLLKDFEFLREEAGKLSKLCSDSVGIAMNTISIADSRASMAQAQRTQMISYLAYLFLPLSIISSIFGMNVIELGQGGPNISLYFMIALPFTFLSISVPTLMAVGRRFLQHMRSRW